MTTVPTMPHEQHEPRISTPRVAILWSRAAGYLRRCAGALASEGAEVLLYERPPIPLAPLPEQPEGHPRVRYETWRGEQPDTTRILNDLADFDPHAVLICSWNVGGYRRIGRSLKGKTLRVLTMDNQWLGTAKQRAGVALSSFIVQPAYDAVFLPAEPQARFAKRLGFPHDLTIHGLYVGDYDMFSSVARRRGDGEWPRIFLYVGRLVEAKAIDVLVEAYQRYRAMVDDPWPLRIVGSGPDEHLCAGVDGVKLEGFVQPGDLPTVFADAGAFVLASRFEPWGVVVHEAAAAGLPVVATEACGATSRLVLDGYNGYVVPSESPSGLSAGLVRIHHATDEGRRSMGAASTMLARQYTPERWAATLLQRIPDLRARVGLPTVRWPVGNGI
jgi:glycosyltransferase involved in cell wall biosynthesis